jgi:purine catabolism regulator
LDIDDFSLLAKKLDDEGKVARKKRQLFELVAKIVKELSPQSILTFKSDTIVILADSVVNSNNSMLPAELSAHLRHLVSDSMKEITVSAGIGRFAANIAAVRESYREAKLALDVFKNAGRRDFQVTFDEVGIYRLFFQSIDNQELISFARHLVGPLMEYDQKKAGSLISTLKAYLNNGCNLTTTAQAAFLHINTVIYRLQKIEEILGISLSDTEARLNIHMALKVLDFVQGNWGD